MASDLLKALTSLAIEKTLVALADEGISVTISGALRYRGLVPPDYFGYNPGQAEVRGLDSGVRAQQAACREQSRQAQSGNRGCWPKGLGQAQSLALCTNLNPLPARVCEE